VLSAREGFGIGVQEVGLQGLNPKPYTSGLGFGTGFKGKDPIKKKMKLQELWSPTKELVRCLFTFQREESWSRYTRDVSVT